VAEANEAAVGLTPSHLEGKELATEEEFVAFSWFLGSVAIFKDGSAFLEVASADYTYGGRVALGVQDGPSVQQALKYLSQDEDYLVKVCEEGGRQRIVFGRNGQNSARFVKIDYSLDLESISELRRVIVYGRCKNIMTLRESIRAQREEALRNAIDRPVAAPVPRIGGRAM